ncbi:MAG: ABC transporter permease [Treponema sp.]|jgi:NitT/TauT family transport system permease protein|nr:ABC transporter permease [Treponema sp.]
MRAVERAAGGALKVSGIAVLLLLWEILSRFRVLDPQFLPSFTQTLMGLGKLLVEGVLFTSVMVSLWRALTGLFIAAAAAVPLGLFLGRRSRNVERCFNPFFRMLAQVNPFSLMPIFILFFGIGEAVKIAVTAWVCLWPLLFNTIEGARNIDPVIIKTARAMASSGPALFFKVIVPGAAASVFSGLRLGLEMSFFMLAAAEMVGASSGLGWLLHNSAMNLQFVRMYGAILASVLLGFGMSKFLKLVQIRTFFWRENLGLSKTEEAGAGRVKRNGDLIFTGALVLLILVLGTWQVEVSRREQGNFNHLPHSGHLSAGSGGME